MQSWKAFNTGNRTGENQFNNKNMLEQKEQLMFFKYILTLIVL